MKMHIYTTFSHYSDNFHYTYLSYININFNNPLYKYMSFKNIGLCII